MPAEIELKLALDPAAIPHLARLARHAALLAVKRGRAKTARLASTYYDTPDFELARRGIALRLRRAGSRWLQTVKGPPLPGAGAGLHARDEHECSLPGPGLDRAHLATTPWRKPLLKALERGELVPQFTTDFERRTIPLEFADGARAEFCIDVGEICAASADRRVPISEIEIEIESGDAARAFELALALVDGWPLAVATASKAERGYALVRGEPDGWHAPVRAQAIALDGDATAETVLRAIAIECLHQIAANAAGLVADADPEWVHQMRIGTRRLRSCLGLLAPLVPATRLDPIIAELRWLAEVLGVARDWDVFAEETLPPLAAGFAQDPQTAGELKRLRTRVAARRKIADVAARDAVRSPRFQRLMLTIGAFCAAPRFGAPAAANAESDVLAATARPYASRLVARRHGKLAKRAQKLARGAPEERHAARIAAKKLRYAAEFFAPLFAAKRTRPYLKALAALQDALGHFNDAATAARLAAELAGAGDTAAGIVRGWVAARAAALEPELERAWRRYARTGKFWTRG